MSRPQNPTGFDIKKLAASSGPGVNDPWARAEAWRYTGPFSRINRFRGLFPGFGIASVAFAAYCAYEYAFLKDDHGHGVGGRGDQEHGEKKEH